MIEVKNKVLTILPNHFEQENHFYPKALNAQIHPMVNFFMNLSNDRIVERYVHLNPMVNAEKLREYLSTPTKIFHWGGVDLFYVTTDTGKRNMVVLETNSCPSGQKSMPARTDHDEHRGYYELIKKSFIPLLKNKKLPSGELAVLYDKNFMESSGYAQTLADLTDQKVYLVPCFNPETTNESPNWKFEDGVLKAKVDGKWINIKAALRYVTQKPWNRIPIHTKTLIYNPVLTCLSGGRNKLLANKAYEIFNAELSNSGLSILYPETIKDVSLNEVPLWVKKFGGYAVVKNPYSNAGQGVYTITSEDELQSFMELEHTYDQFIVQSLIGHRNWSSTTSHDSQRYYHIGTVPNKHGKIFVADLRMMSFSGPEGFKPVAIYARRTRSPLNPEIKGEDSWTVLGTNLSVKIDDNKWDSDTSRLLLMDRKDFNILGVGLDDLVEGYIQSVLSIKAIDQMASMLVGPKGKFKSKLFHSLDNDKALLKEIELGQQ